MIEAKVFRQTALLKKIECCLCTSPDVSITSELQYRNSSYRSVTMWLLSADAHDLIKISYSIKYAMYSFLQQDCHSVADSLLANIFGSRPFNYKIFDGVIGYQQLINAKASFIATVIADGTSFRSIEEEVVGILNPDIVIERLEQG